VNEGENVNFGRDVVSVLTYRSRDAISYVLVS